MGVGAGIGYGLATKTNRNDRFESCVINGLFGWRLKLDEDEPSRFTMVLGTLVLVAAAALEAPLAIVAAATPLTVPSNSPLIVVTFTIVKDASPLLLRKTKVFGVFVDVALETKLVAAATDAVDTLERFQLNFRWVVAVYYANDERFVHKERKSHMSERLSLCNLFPWAVVVLYLRPRQQALRYQQPEALKHREKEEAR